MLKYEPKWGERGGNDLAFYCQSSVGTIPFQGRVFLLLTFCKQNSSLQQLLSHMATVCLCTNCPRANSMRERSWPHGLEKVEHELGIGCYHNFHHKISARKRGKGVCSGVCSGLCFWIFYVVAVAVVVVIVDVDDEEGERGGEDAQRRKSKNLTHPTRAHTHKHTHTLYNIP